MDFDLEELVNIEQTFYDSGYADGRAHGRIHGLIEGRALGREKGFEIGEELGFYEGAARIWELVYVGQGKETHRAVSHARALLTLLSTFPSTNPHEEDGIDISALLRQVRSRYKALCASVGIRPSLRAGESGDREENIEGSGGQGDAKKRSVWKVDATPGAETGLSF
ncbi:DUF1715-domain-containing protein [Peniophora sp. CONT]|nr:DUF1715-domain-containing protein [Peniophora sp. CONT]